MEKNYQQVKQQMLQLIKKAAVVIEEIEKEYPNHITICDIAIEEMGDLIENVSSTILGDSSPINNPNFHIRK